MKDSITKSASANVVTMPAVERALVFIQATPVKRRSSRPSRQHPSVPRILYREISLRTMKGILIVAFSLGPREHKRDAKNDSGDAYEYNRSQQVQHIYI